jgi:preprotein translocase subunit SecD
MRFRVSDTKKAIYKKGSTKMNKMYALSIAALIAIGSTTACQTKPETSNNAANQNVNKANSANRNTEQKNTNIDNTIANDAKTETNSTGEKSASTPTGVYKAYYAAHKNKDVAAIKKLISKDMYEFFEMIGEGKPNPLDDGIKEICNEPQGTSDEVRNEKISGDKATLQIQNPKGEWITADFVKEDGVWKMTVAKIDEPDGKARSKKIK